MDVINFLMEKIVGFIDSILPSMGFSTEFLSGLDNALSTLIGLVQGAGYFIPLNVVAICFGAMLVVDNFALLSRVGQFVIKLIRG